MNTAKQCISCRQTSRNLWFS